MTSVVYLWSQYSPISSKYLTFMSQKGGMCICVDHPDVRKKITSGKIRVSEIPCLLVTSNNQLAQFEGVKAIEWIEYQLQRSQPSHPSQPQHPSQQYQQPPQSLQSHQPLQPSQLIENPDIKFEMIPNQHQNEEEDHPIALGPMQPIIGSMEPPSGIASQEPPLFTPVSQLTPDNDTPSTPNSRQNFNQNLQMMNQQASNYYSQNVQNGQNGQGLQNPRNSQVFSIQNSAQPERPERRRPPREEEYQRMLAMAKENAEGTDNSSNHVLGSMN